VASPASAEAPRVVLVADRDIAVRRTIVHQFRQEEFDVYDLDDPRRAAEKLEAVQARIVLVELGGPLRFDPLLAIRESSSIPVVGLLWAEVDADEATALDLGADDCVRRPFSMRHLVARTRAVLRRSGPAPDQRLRFGPLTIDPPSRTVKMGDRYIDLTAREFDLLAFLAGRPGIAFTRETLLTEVWQSSAAWQQRETVTEHIHRLRARLEPDPSRPEYLLTVRGVGYRFAPPVPS
jgi:two-component system, OmpR family, phosphate regulon response regulator PhoB